MAHNSVSFHLTTQIMFAVHARDFAWSCRMGGLARHLRENMLKGDLVSVCEEKVARQTKIQNWIQEFLKEGSDTDVEAQLRFQNVIKPILDSVFV